MHYTRDLSNLRERNARDRSTASALRAAISCACVVAIHGCAFPTKPSPEEQFEQAPAVEEVAPASHEASPASMRSSAAAADSGSAQGLSASAAGSGSAPAASSTRGSASPTGMATMATITPSMSSGPQPSNHAAAKPPTVLSDEDAGTPAPNNAPAADAGAISPAMRQKCDADLSSCLLADPLGYDTCLRKNAQAGCPPSETQGASTTTPVLDEHGNPISQVCQAELAKCIMRLPTPENAAECTDTARKCK